MAVIGPNYARTEKFEAELSGTQFSFIAPSHNRPGVPDKGAKSNRKNIFEIVIGLFMKMM